MQNQRPIEMYKKINGIQFVLLSKVKTSIVFLKLFVYLYFSSTKFHGKQNDISCILWLSF